MQQGHGYPKSRDLGAEWNREYGYPNSRAKWGEGAPRVPHVGCPLVGACDSQRGWSGRGGRRGLDFILRGGAKPCGCCTECQRFKQARGVKMIGLLSPRPSGSSVHAPTRGHPTLFA